MTDHTVTAVVKELTEAFQQHLIPIFKKHGLGVPYFFVEESIGETDDGLVTLHAEAPDQEPTSTVGATNIQPQEKA